jgi:hypothetical protein
LEILKRKDLKNMDENNQVQIKRNENRNVIIKVRADTYATVEYYDGALAEIFIKINYSSILLEPRDLIDFCKLVEEIKKELAR